MQYKTRWARQQPGFTIVELLIVIVVIAILAAIAVVAYNGIQNRANDAAVQADMRKIGLALQNYITLNNSLPTSEAALKTVLENSEIKGKIARNAYNITQPATPGNAQSRNLLICVSGGSSSTLKFGVGALSKSGTVYQYTSANGLKVDTTEWIGQQTEGCPKLGVTVNDPLGYARTFGFGTDTTPTAGWQAWTQ